MSNTEIEKRLANMIAEYQANTDKRPIDRLSPDDMNTFSYLHISDTEGKAIHAEINADYQKKHDIEYELDWCPRQLWIHVPNLISAEKLRPFLKSQNYNKINVFNSPVDGQDCMMIRGEYRSVPYSCFNQDISKRLYDLYTAMGLNIQYSCASPSITYSEIELTMENIAALRLILEADSEKSLSIHAKIGHYDTVDLHSHTSVTETPKVSFKEAQERCFQLMQARKEAL